MSKSAKELSTELLGLVLRDVRMDGWITEGNYAVNQKSTDVLDAILEENGECHVWELNPYNDYPVHVKYVGGSGHWNYGSLATPTMDLYLAGLILYRIFSPYEGTGRDSALVDEIMDYAHSIGGHNLFWA
jgi:hypothetical protein